MSSWFSVQKGSCFSLANIPFGIISTKRNSVRRPAVAIGEHALDLATFASQGGFEGLENFPKDKLGVFSETSLNSFAYLGRPVHRAVRNYLRDVFRDDTPYPAVLKTNEKLKEAALTPLSDVESHLPLVIGDYTDFFAGRNHAHNVGTLFRGAANALQPNYNHVPVAYHGRASSVVVSGTPLRRPWGQALPTPTSKEPAFRPSAKLDIELELGMFLCKGNQLGQPIPVDEAEEFIFGFVLMNDWSARDIQQWEYVPLGPFNAKNLGTSISPWVVLADALEPFKGQGLSNEVELQPYLREKKKDNIIDIRLEVSVKTAKGTTTTLTHTSSRNLLWFWDDIRIRARHIW
ncbi:fumarylacetoacetate (FAA) hydrolase family protein [Hirsutella rhossiliensis]|uniref:Fumarylacetoacetase n=1 Tax=Hirsutella rhossiliensis TaxID=111463 RepID=A0A9P8SD33_9HYPO|nr:fumarylacetoacetate (FAA) hydrolase family domain-containing protein [Hirsutella rhossiliensis]KAH0958186.1 fumarylacetoacetate (FAA) hydrolase family domain-containing protein [Hirsutella rhossiliensis]